MTFGFIGPPILHQNEFTTSKWSYSITVNILRKCILPKSICPKIFYPNVSYPNVFTWLVLSLKRLYPWWRRICCCLELGCVPTKDKLKQRLWYDFFSTSLANVKMELGWVSTKSLRMWLIFRTCFLQALQNQTWSKCILYSCTIFHLTWKVYAQQQWVEVKEVACSPPHLVDCPTIRDRLYFMTNIKVRNMKK